jgi:hypothetical protein
LLLEKFVSARMVFVVMRVDNEAHRLVGNAFKRLLNSPRQRSVLIIHDHNPVIANRRANVASCPRKHVNISRYFRNFDLHLAEVLILRQAHHRRKKSE